MRKSLIRWVLLAVIVLGIIIGGPIIINEFYRNNSGYITIWGAADVLTYYGAIIAASGAAIGVYCSIRYSHKQYREDKRRDVLPYFAINILGRKCVSPFDLGWYGEDDVREEDKAKEALTYREFMYDECFFIFSDDKIECIRKLSEEQEAARTIGVTMEDHGEFGTNLRNDRHYIPMKITNVGKGCAINTKITILSQRSKGRLQLQYRFQFLLEGKYIPGCFFTFMKSFLVNMIMAYNTVIFTAINMSITSPSQKRLIGRIVEFRLQKTLRMH